MRNLEIADLFERVADMLAIRGDNVHRINAYRRASESIRGLSRDINAIAAEDALEEIPGIGATLAEKIEEMLETGGLEFYDKLAKEIPPALVDMLRVEGLGPKRIKIVYEQLGVTTLDDLREVAQSGKLSELSGFGTRTEKNIIKSLDALERHGDERTLLGVAWPVAQEILTEIRALPQVSKAEVGGSLRRFQETIGDIDMLAAAKDPEPVMEAFATLPQVEAVIVRGPSKTTVQLHNGMQVDLRVLPPERWGTALSYFTGNKEHNVRLREMALKKGLSLNEHSFRPMVDGEPTTEGEITCATEEEVYEVLGLPYIAPRLRQDQGEIEAAKRGALPKLVTLEDIRGDLHMHSTWSDGRLSILEMARAARERGRHYIAITDHSVGLGIANGLSVERLLAQADEVRDANAAMGDEFVILHGTEMEIRADGTLDFPDDVLAQLDFVIASLHVSLSQAREQVTERALAAINNPHVDMLAHPTGRLFPDRLGADLDMDVVLEAAREAGTILEINANPRRLDLRDTHARRAIELGVHIAINTDAHNAGDMDLMHYGIAVAQRGWATAEAVTNTWDIDRLRAHLERHRA